MIVIQKLGLNCIVLNIMIFKIILSINSGIEISKRTYNYYTDTNSIINNTINGKQIYYTTDDNVILNGTIQYGHTLFHQFL